MMLDGFLEVKVKVIREGQTIFYPTPATYPYEVLLKSYHQFFCYSKAIVDQKVARKSKQEKRR